MFMGNQPIGFLSRVSARPLPSVKLNEPLARREKAREPSRGMLASLADLGGSLDNPAVRYFFRVNSTLPFELVVAKVFASSLSIVSSTDCSASPILKVRTIFLPSIL